MKVATHFVVAGCLLAGTSALFGRQPAAFGPQLDQLPAPLYVEGEEHLDPTNDENFWSPPPMPPLPCGFMWDGYYGAAVEHDLYGHQRLHPPPRKTVSCHGLLVGLTDSVQVMFSYPTPHRPPPMYCPKNGCGRCVPGKFSYGTRSHGHCGCCCACQSQQAAIVYEPALLAPQPVPMPEPETAPTFQPQLVQPRIAPARPLVPVRPLVPPVLIDDTGLPALPLTSEDPRPAATAPMPPPPGLTQDPRELPRNKIPARDGR